MDKKYKDNEFSKKYVILCEDSMEGVFSAIYKIYEQHFEHERTHLRVEAEEEYELFTEYTVFETDEKKAEKVIRTIIREFGEECYKTICLALSGCDKRKADDVYHMIVYGFTLKYRRNLIHSLENDYVNRTFQLSREVNNEIMRLKEFVRFQELENGVLFSRIGPKNDILTFLIPHFEDRLPNENFVIYDEVRNFSAVHPAYKKFILVRGTEYDNNILRGFSKEEESYAELFKLFCKSISIKERENKNLQRQMLPLRFRKYMTEFNELYF